MAISIDPLTFVITVPKADTLLVQSVPIEIRELNLDTFRLALKSWEDNEGITFLKTHNHNTTSTVSGVQLARVIVLLDPYTVTFEDGAYAVNLVGANSNVGDKINLNSVSVRSSNSAGLIQTREIEYSSFNGGVTVDAINGLSGTDYPKGTPAVPVNNIPDAVFIANLRGFDTIHIKGNITLGPGDVLDQLTIHGQTQVLTTITVNAGASTNTSWFSTATIQGVLDGGSNITDCIIKDLDFVDGTIQHSRFDGLITLSGANDLHAVDCYSGVIGGLTPRIDMGGAGSGLGLRGYKGGLKIINKTGAADSVSIDLDSGQIILDSTVTAGDVIIRGVGKLINNATGTANVVEELLDSRNLYKSTFVNGLVYLDASSSISGTAYPKGSIGNAVNNLTDALTIVANNGLSGISLVGFHTATGAHNLDGVEVIGGSGSGNVLVLDGVSTNQSSFQRLIVTGTVDGLSRFNNCILGTTGLGGLVGLQGRIVDCIINHTSGVTQEATGAGCLFDNCSFITPNDLQVTLNANGKAFGLRNCTGNILVTNGTSIEDQQIHLSGARIEIAASCTAGQFTLDGMGTLVDNSGGTTIVDNLVIAGSGVILPGDIQDIASAVWDEDKSGHTIPGSYGEIVQKLNTNMTIALGLMGRNYKITNQVYNAQGNLLSCRTKTFNNAQDCIDNINPLSEHDVTVIYDGTGKRVTDYIAVAVL